MYDRAMADPPEWEVAEWLNAAVPSTLASLRGEVVLACAFQMLCPGCVAHALPLMQGLHEHFGPLGLRAIGLHTVFEHHAAMTPVALCAFLHEYRIGFPVGIDRPDPAGGPMPLTMAAYRMRGTPTFLLYDRGGRLRGTQFGHAEELGMAAAVTRLLMEPEAGQGG
jgi:hypothetical protein